MYKFHSRYGFFNILFVFMPVIVKCDEFTIIVINTGSSDNRTSKITANVFDGRSGVAFLRFGIDIEPMRMIFVTGRFNLFERRIKMLFHFIKESCTESISKECIIKMFNIAPETVITIAAFRNETVDVRVPF